MSETTKTHWLQNPNKNYLGHWDFPNGEDMILTIKSAQWEEVKNPIINVSEAKRVIRFNEDVKPFICNETNAQSILNVTGIRFMEDVGGEKIQLFVGKHKDNRTKEEIDCVRIRPTKPVIEKKPLTKEHPHYDRAIKALIEGNTTVDKIKLAYTVSEEVEKELKDAKNLS